MVPKDRVNLFFCAFTDSSARSEFDQVSTCWNQKQSRTEVVRFGGPGSVRWGTLTLRCRFQGRANWTVG